MVVVHKIGDRFYLSVNGAPMVLATADEIKEALGL